MRLFVCNWLTPTKWPANKWLSNRAKENSFNWHFKNENTYNKWRSRNHPIERIFLHQITAKCQEPKILEIEDVKCRTDLLIFISILYDSDTHNHRHHFLKTLFDISYLLFLISLLNTQVDNLKLGALFCRFLDNTNVQQTFFCLQIS